MLTRFDRWVGRTLFVPPIIRLCQWTGWTQWKVSRYATMAFWLYEIQTNSPSALWLTFNGLNCLVAVVLAATRADQPMAMSVSVMSFARRFVLVCLTIDIILFAITLSVRGAPLAWLLLLVAFYAASIDTIPPLAAKERKASLAEKPA